MTMEAFNWTCPFCSSAQVVVDHNCDSKEIIFYTGEVAPNRIGIQTLAICCANPACKKHTVKLEVRRWDHKGSSGPRWLEHEPDFSRQIIPESGAKPFPDHIPEPLREDYLEACLIKEFSPKASATLSRRCLQGMIRDFTGVTGRTLHSEIEELSGLAKNDQAPRGVSVDSIDSLHHVRSLGNIGAHMEKDINLVIPVDPEEAQILIELIETLFDEWYVARERRKKRFDSLRIAAEGKESLRKSPKPEQT